MFRLEDFPVEPRLLLRRQRGPLGFEVDGIQPTDTIQGLYFVGGLRIPVIAGTM
ncbi:hypothetical protein D3C71_1801360 [compost metagenome]